MSKVQLDTLGVDAAALLQTPKRLQTVLAPTTQDPPYWEYTLRGHLPLPLVDTDVRWQILPEGMLCFTLWVPDGTQAALPALLRRIADIIDADARKEQPK